MTGAPPCPTRAGFPPSFHGVAKQCRRVTAPPGTGASRAASTSAASRAPSAAPAGPSLLDGPHARLAAGRGPLPDALRDRAHAAASPACGARRAGTPPSTPSASPYAALREDTSDKPGIASVHPSHELARRRGRTSPPPTTRTTPAHVVLTCTSRVTPAEPHPAPARRPTGGSVLASRGGSILASGEEIVETEPGAPPRSERGRANGSPE